MRQKDIRPAPARIEFKGMKFLITDRPSDQDIPNYIMVSIIHITKYIYLGKFAVCQLLIRISFEPIKIGAQEK